MIRASQLPLKRYYHYTLTTTQRNIKSTFPRLLIEQQQQRRNYCGPLLNETKKETTGTTQRQPPKSSEIVVIGGGVIGCSVAYHLAKMGKQVTLLERSGLTHGSTWHAAGLVGQLRGSHNMTRMLQYSAELYRTLTQDTGHLVEWKEVGSLRFASSAERWLEIQKSYGMAKSFGFEMHLIDPQEAKRLCPIIDTNGLHGAAWIPSDGYVDPTSLTMALAKGARKYGATLIEGVEVTGFLKKERNGQQWITHVLHSHGSTSVDYVVNCGGIFARSLGLLMGTAVPTTTVQHQYLVTTSIPGISDNIPTFRDPDYLVYYKPEIEGLVMGGWETNTIPVDLPANFGPELFSPDFERFEQHLRGAEIRVPAMKQAGIKQLINGPIPVSADGEPLLGRTSEVWNAFVAAGFTAGIAGAGGAGKYLAEWIVHGAPSINLWPLDIRRFGKSHSSLSFLHQRTVEAYGDYYKLKMPFKEYESARGVRKSPLHEMLKQQGAVFGQKFGYERPNWFAKSKDNAEDRLTFGFPNWWKEVGEEHQLCREKVALMDLSSFSKLEISGRDAHRLLQRITANSIKTLPQNGIVYTQLCNANGGIESDVTVIQISPQAYYVVTGSGYGVRDFGWIKDNVKEDEEVLFNEVSSAFAVINLCGPDARKVLQKVTEEDVSNEAFPFMTWKSLYVGMAPLRALRVTFIGELGWELHVPSEYAQDLYRGLMEAGREFGIGNAGYRSISSLRCEKGYRFWGSDIGPETNPFEAGLGFCVSFDEQKEHTIGREALQKISESSLSRKFVCFTINDSPHPIDGNEAIYFDGKIIGLTTSAGYGYTVGKHVAFGYVPTELTKMKQGFQIEVYGTKINAKIHPINKSLYDPDRKKILS